MSITRPSNRWMQTAKEMIEKARQTKALATASLGDEIPNVASKVSLGGINPETGRKLYSSPAMKIQELNRSKLGETIWGSENLNSYPHANHPAGTPKTEPLNPMNGGRSRYVTPRITGINTGNPTKHEYDVLGDALASRRMNFTQKAQSFWKNGVLNSITEMAGKSWGHSRHYYNAASKGSGKFFNNFTKTTSDAWKIGGEGFFSGNFAIPMTMALGAGVGLAAGLAGNIFAPDIAQTNDHKLWNITKTAALGGALYAGRRLTKGTSGLFKDAPGFAGNAHWFARKATSVPVITGALGIASAGSMMKFTHPVNKNRDRY